MQFTFSNKEKFQIEKITLNIVFSWLLGKLGARRRVTYSKHIMSAFLVYIYIRGYLFRFSYFFCAAAVNKPKKN